jgi:hypothetical protein
VTVPPPVLARAASLALSRAAPVIGCSASSVAPLATAMPAPAPTTSTIPAAAAAHFVVFLMADSLCAICARKSCRNGLKPC